MTIWPRDSRAMPLDTLAHVPRPRRRLSQSAPGPSLAMTPLYAWSISTTVLCREPSGLQFLRPISPSPLDCEQITVSVVVKNGVK